MKLFNELDGFKKQHNQKIDTGKIEKYLELDVVDYTININTDDFNAVRSNDADPEGTSRLANIATAEDLSACAAPGNVNKDLNANDADPEATSRFGEATTAADLSVPIDIGGASVNVKKVDCFNADRSRDAVRLANVATTTDLTASARPDNVNNLKKK
ncbi:MAG TPA: hypothetical protein VJ946_02270 [Bacteroidales bacterium]|nr:hypothetical protein [Bacteroidales bacterium]